MIFTDNEPTHEELRRHAHDLRRANLRGLTTRLRDHFEHAAKVACEVADRLEALADELEENQR